MLLCSMNVTDRTDHVLGHHGDVAAGQGQMNDTAVQGQGHANAVMFQGNILTLYGLP